MRHHAKGRKFFTPGPPTGKKVAVIGSGPAGLTCAHELRKRGHDVVVFEARDVAGGLNTLGIAAYKISTEFALSEVELVRQIGVDIRLNERITGEGVSEIAQANSTRCSSASGLGHTLPLGILGENVPGVWEALDFIFQTHTQALRRVRSRPARACDRRGQHRPSTWPPQRLASAPTK